MEQHERNMNRDNASNGSEYRDDSSSNRSSSYGRSRQSGSDDRRMADRYYNERNEYGRANKDWMDDEPPLGEYRGSDRAQSSERQRRSQNDDRDWRQEERGRQYGQSGRSSRDYDSLDYDSPEYDSERYSARDQNSQGLGSQSYSSRGQSSRGERMQGQGSQSFGSQDSRSQGQGSRNYGSQGQSSQGYGAQGQGSQEFGSRYGSSGYSPQFSQGNQGSWMQRGNMQGADEYGGMGSSVSSTRGDRRGEHYGKGPKGFQYKDEDLERRVSRLLYKDGRVDASDIEVQVKDGEVTLSGTVQSRELKNYLEDRIESEVDGVREVNNMLRVKRDQYEGSSAAKASSGASTASSSSKGSSSSSKQ